jgi:chemotaxis protein MotB
MAEETARRRRKFGGENTEGDEEPWLITYGDMMTLLMTFFVLLFSMSTIDPVKLEQFSDSVGDALGGKQKTEQFSLAEIFKEVAEVIEEENLKGIVEVETSPRGVSIVLPSNISFASGSAELDPNIFPLLNKFESMMSNSIFPIGIEGHTDNEPISSPIYPSNWELSSARAAQVVRYYIARGVPGDRFQAIGLADTKPRAEGKTVTEANSTPQKRAMNRRVEIFFLTMR